MYWGGLSDRIGRKPVCYLSQWPEPTRNRFWLTVLGTIDGLLRYCFFPLSCWFLVKLLDGTCRQDPGWHIEREHRSDPNYGRRAGEEP